MEALNETILPQNEFTPDQKEKINQFRERVVSLLKPDQANDNYMVKWLIARRFDVDKAEDMLKKHLRFAKANGLEKILEEYTPPEVVDYFFTAKLGYDKDGSVVRILHVGASDLRGLCLSISKIDCLKYACYTLMSDEVEQKKDRKNATICDKQVYIMDLKDLSWRAIIQRIVVDRAIMLLRSYEANYPERLKVAYIVNVPSFFSFIYNWLKTILPDTIISKLEIISEEDCASKLTKAIDPSILPASLGGIRRDPDGDPNCPSLYRKPLGAPVPEDLMPAEQLEALKNDPDAKKITVYYNSVFIAEKSVKEPNSVLLWDFQTIDYDIRMGLRYKPDEESEAEEIIPCHRVDCHLIPESGNFACDKSGIYELVFDNTYSWMTSKELIFKVNLLPPRQDIHN